MKWDWLVAVLAVVLAAASAEAQVRRGRGWSNSLEVAVVNVTDDGNPVIVHDNKGNLILAHGESQVFSLGGGILGVPYRTVDLRVTFCDGGVVESRFAPPEWSTDLELFGSAALPEILSRTTSKKDLERRVEKIKDIMKEKDLLGRKRLERELESWLKLVKRSGPGGTTTSCVPLTVESERFDVPVYYGGYHNDRRSITLFARGSAERGYQLSRR